MCCTRPMYSTDVTYKNLVLLISQIRYVNGLYTRIINGQREIASDGKVWKCSTDDWLFDIFSCMIELFGVVVYDEELMKNKQHRLRHSTKRVMKLYWKVYNKVRSYFVPNQKYTAKRDRNKEVLGE